MKEPEDLSVNLTTDAVAVCLVGAVIKQAIVDYFNPQLCGSVYHDPKHKRLSDIRRRSLQEDAKKFLFTHDIDDYLQNFGLTINMVHLRKLIHKCQNIKYRTNLLSAHPDVLMENLWI